MQVQKFMQGDSNRYMPRPPRASKKKIKHGACGPEGKAWDRQGEYLFTPA